MNHIPAPVAPQFDSAQQSDLLLERFEQAWHSGPPPVLVEFWAALKSSEKRTLANRDLLAELIKIDLEYRWRSARPATIDQTSATANPDGTMELKLLRMQDYFTQFPELGSVHQAPLDLIVEEYRVRQQWGDRPPHQDYQKRFPQHAAVLPEILSRLDRELAVENAGSEKFRKVSGSKIANLPLIPGYEILSVLGQGGMGIVYKARQIALNRLVAVKTILAESPAATDLHRFTNEAQAMARLQHLNIVQVYDVSDLDGRPFLTMEFIDGGNLKQKLSTGLPTPIQAAQFVETLTHGVHAAHQRGILHRDLKPQNILLVGPRNASLDQCTSKITDFGLAKCMDNLMGPTTTGAVLGTPSYMSPEQAEGRTQDIGPLVDVYSLGAILYELLTGQPPFLADTPLDTILQVISDPPKPPSQVRPNVPKALENICLKCLQKDPAKRFGDCEALADALRRFRTSRRRPAPRVKPSSMPAMVSLLAGIAGCSIFLGVTIVVVAVSTWLVWRGGKNEPRAEMPAQKAQLPPVAVIALLAKDKEKPPAIAGKKVWQELAPGVPERVLMGHKQFVNSIAFSGDGTKALSGSWDTTVRWWDLEKGQELHAFTEHTGRVECVALSPDGQWAISGGWDNIVRLWNLNTGKQERTFLGSTRAIKGVAFSPTDHRIFACCSDNFVLVWDRNTGKQIDTWVGHSSSIYSIAISADGRKALTGSIDRTARLWDVATGNELGRFDHATGVALVAFVPQGQTWRALTVSHKPSKVHWWNLDNLQEVKRIDNLPGPKLNNAFAFSSDGERMLSTCMDDMSVRLFDLGAGKELQCFMGHKHRVIPGLAISPDGRRALSGSGNGEIIMWKMPDANIEPRDAKNKNPAGQAKGPDD